MDRVLLFRAVRQSDQQLSPGSGRNRSFYVFVYVSIGMAGDCDRLLPARQIRGDPLYQNRRAEYRAVQNSADRAIGRFPHLLEMVFLHSGGIGRDRGALHSNSILFCRHGGIYCYLVVGFIPVLKPQVIVFHVQVEIGEKQNLFDHAPDDPGHFISVHLHQGSVHFYFFSVSHY